jgi:hypothetical protein
MAGTGTALLGTNLYDILSPSKPQVMTIGNTSNDAYVTFYNSNAPYTNAYNMGLSNNTFVVLDLTGTTKVGINTFAARHTLDVTGTIGLEGLYGHGESNFIDINQSSFSNLKDVYYTGVVYKDGVAVTSQWLEGSNGTVYTTANVGIGTVVYPEYSLDIGGDINFYGGIYRSNIEFRESQFRQVLGSGSNIYYGGSVGIGATDGAASNEMVTYKMFVSGDVAIDGRLYANDFIIYKGENPGKYKEVDIYGISPYSENKTIVTNSTDSACNVLYEFRLKASQYMTFVNLPYKNLSGSVEVGGKNWFEVALVAGSASNYHYTSNFISKVPIEVRSSGCNVDIDNVEFFIESGVEQDYVLAVRGFGHTLEFGGVSFDFYGSPFVQYNSRLRIIPIKNIGDDNSFSVKKALQITPIRQQYILGANTSNFTFSVEGSYVAAASNVDVFINGLKYVYYTNLRKDYDIGYSYNFDTNLTTFTLDLMEPAQKDDVVDIAIWPYATADTLFASGYYYQNINNFPTQWLNVSSGMGVRYPKSVVVDGDLIVRGNIVGGCNTDIFYAGLPTGDLAFTCNVVGTTNIIDGAIVHSKLAFNAVRAYNIPDYTIPSVKMNFKDQIVAIGCNLNEVVINPVELPRNRGLYVDGDVFIKGLVQACNFAGNTESIADLSVTNIKMAPNSITFDKIAPYSVSNITIASDVISNRHLQVACVLTSNLALRSVNSDRIGIGSVLRTNLASGVVGTGEIENGAVTVGKLNLVSGNVGIGTGVGLSKLHVIGDALLVGGVRAGVDGLYDIGQSNLGYRNAYFSDSVYFNNYRLRQVEGRFEVLRGNGSVSDLRVGNIGIGTGVGVDRIDIVTGGIVLRAGNIGIGTTVARGVLDALAVSGGKLLVGQIGVGTAVLGGGESMRLFGGGVYVDSGDVMVEGGRIGVGIGTGSLGGGEKVAVVGGEVRVDNEDGVALRGVGSNLLVGVSVTREVVPEVDGMDVGREGLGYRRVYTEEVRLGSGGSGLASVSYSNSAVAVSGGLRVSGEVDAVNFYPYRNLLINGGMLVNQRYPGSNNYIVDGKSALERYTLDRFESFASNVSTQLVIGQSNVGRDYVLSCRVGISTSSVNGTGAHLLAGQKIEYGVMERLGWGGDGALGIAVSFDLLSPVNETYYLGLHNWDRSRSLVRDVVAVGGTGLVRYSYVIPGDSSGDWSGGAGVGIGLQVGLYAGVGSSFVTGTAGVWEDGTFYGRSSSTSFVGVGDGVACVTNFQVEVGGMATVFEKRPLAVERRLCQRYYEKSYNLGVLPGSSTSAGSVLVYCGTSDGGSTNWIAGNVDFKVEKRSDSWSGHYYSVGGTVGKLSYRDAGNGNFVDYTESITPSASNTVFTLPSERGYGTNFQVNAQSSRTYAYQWVVDNEL